MRVELAYLGPSLIEHVKERGVGGLDGWWVEVTFDDGSTFRVSESTFDGEVEDDDGRDDEVGDGSEDAVDDDGHPWVHETFLRWRESQTLTDGNQVVASRLFTVVGPGRMVSVCSGWERVGLAAGGADLATAATFRELATTRGARPPGWLTHMAYHPSGDSADGVASYTMEWDWPSKLLRWVEVLPDGSMRAHVIAKGSPMPDDGAGLPTPDLIATAAIPQRLPITGSTFEGVWNVARTTGRVPDARHGAV